MSNFRANSIFYRFFSKNLTILYFFSIILLESVLE